MRGKSLSKFFLTVLLNGFLLLGVFFTYQILGVAHILIFFLSFDNLLSNKNFKSDWKPQTFVLISCLPQLIYSMLWIVAGILHEGPAVMVLVIAVGVFIELIISRSLYGKFRKLQTAKQF